MDYNYHNPSQYDGPQYNPQYGGSPYGGGMPSRQAITTQTNAVMRKVYFRMFIGLLITAFCSLGIASNPLIMYTILGNQLVFWGMLIGMLVMAWVIPSRALKMSQGTLLILFGLFSALMGVWIAPIFYVYELGSICYTFFISAGTFGAMSVYGYFTKTDLSKFGSYLVMALFGLIILSVVNIFLGSSTLEWVVSIVGVLIFIGLTAWDTQQVRRLAAANMDPGVTDRLATVAAMSLYLDFINLFLYLLRILGRER